MENFPNPNRRLKKIKRPIKKPVNIGDDLAVPAKTVSENPFNRNDSFEDTEFDLNNYLEEDNLPAIQQDYPTQNRLNPAFVSEDDDIEDTPPSLKDHFIVGNLYTKMALIITAAFCLLFGMFVAKAFLSSPSVVHNGLQGVIVNPEVPRGRARCGVAEKTQGCVLYIMNPQRQDLNGRDFYDLAAQLTGRQRFMVETGNMRYAGVKVRPGEISQINIPPLQ